MFLKLTTDNGIEGIGEAYGVPFGPHVVARMIEDVVEQHVVGESPFNIERVRNRMDVNVSRNEVAKGLLDMACYDLETDDLFADLSVHELL